MYENLLMKKYQSPKKILNEMISALRNFSLHVILFLLLHKNTFDRSLGMYILYLKNFSISKTVHHVTQLNNRKNFFSNIFSISKKVHLLTIL